MYFGQSLNVESIHSLSTIMSTTMLDHTAYPDLIDTIVSNCTPETILAFCSTSKQYRKKLATWLSHSSFYREGNTNHRLTSKLPSAPASLPFVPALVEVLDMDDDACWSRHANLHAARDPTLSAFTSLRTIRRMDVSTLNNDDCTCFGDTSWRLPRPTTDVDFIQVDTLPSYDRCPMIRMGPATERYVLHIRWRNDNSFRLPGYHMSIDKSHVPPLDVTIVLWSPGLPGSVECAAMLVSWILHRFGSRWEDQIGWRRAKQLGWQRVHEPGWTQEDLVGWRWEHRGHFDISLTIVGVEALGLESSEMDVDDEHTTQVQKFVGFVMDHLDQDLDSTLPYARSLLEDAKFKTVDQWHASLGNDMVTLGHWP